tara:strand:+ start:1039 stop:2049 length:1011 start_codon:yes stop_codon:yes gene_type:complete
MRNFRPALILICSLLFGCVETLITIDVLPDARYRMGIISKGDKEDIEDNDFMLPSSKEWNTKRFKEIDEETGDIIHFSSSESLLKGTNLLIKNNHRGGLRYPISVKLKKGFFSDTYILHQLFEGRGVDKKYPTLAQALLEPGDESKQIIAFTEVMLHCLEESLYNSSSSSTIEDLLKERIVNHFNGVFYKAGKDENLKDIVQKQKSESANTISLPENFMQSNFQPFQSMLPSGNIDSLLIGMLPCIDEANSTIKLNDDTFKLISTLPGRVFMSNSDSTYNDTLLWSFDLKDFTNDSYAVEAASIIYYPKKIQKAILVGTILILFVLFLIAKRKAIL